MFEPGRDKTGTSIHVKTTHLLGNVGIDALLLVKGPADDGRLIQMSGHELDVFLPTLPTVAAVELKHVCWQEQEVMRGFCRGRTTKRPADLRHAPNPHLVPVDGLAIAKYRISQMR